MLFVFVTAAAALLLGFSWRDEAFALLGLLGFGIFLYGQLRFDNFFLCLFQAIVVGYVGYVIANPWMLWTVEGIFKDQSPRITSIVHGVHLFHGGIYCAFAIAWWGCRRFVRGGWVLAPAIWIIVETLYPAMFPMRHGCLLLSINPLVQISSVLGVLGATLQFLLIASLVPLGILWYQKSYLGNIGPTVAKYCCLGILALTVANFAWGSLRIQNLESERVAYEGDYLKIGVVQGDTEHAQFHDNFVKRTRELGEQQCELVLWPECSLGRYDRELTDFSNHRSILKYSYGFGFQFLPFEDPNCHLLAAGYSYTPKPGLTEFDDLELETKYVSAYLFDLEEQMLGRHDKVKLMAGGEYVPGEDYIPALAAWLRDSDDLTKFKLSKGEEPQPIGEIGNMNIGVMLCCEDMYSDVGRILTRNGSDLLVCLANGMTFNSEIVLRQHFNIARFRAIENNRYFARCGSYGVSGLLAPSGVILQEKPCFDEAEFSINVPVEKRADTIFTRTGDLLFPGSCLLLIGLTLTSFGRRLFPKSTDQTVD